VAPLWRRRARRSLASLGQWYWHTDSEVDLDYHVQISALPCPAGEAELWEFASELHTAGLDRSRPLWQMHLIEGLADGRYALYLKTHPALADGVAAMRLLQHSLNSDPDRRGMPALWEMIEHAPEGSEDDATAPASARALMATRGLAGAARELAGMAPALADTAWRAVRRRGGPLTLAAPHTPLNVPIGSAKSVAGRTFPIDRVRLVAKHTDATVNDVVLAMCAGALRRYLLARRALPETPLMAALPVSLRGAEPLTSPVPPDYFADNKIAALTCSLATHLADPAERLAAVQISTREGKAALAGRTQLQVMTMTALGAAPLALAMTLGRELGPLRPANVMISNVRGPHGPLYWNGARLEALYPMSIPVDGQTLTFSCTSIDDQIAFGLTACRRAVPGISTLADYLGRELDLLDTFHRIPDAVRRDRGRDPRPRRRRAPRRSNQT
jgi:WS/DGAT/MGAT family acyltransferase